MGGKVRCAQGAALLLASNVRREGIAYSWQSAEALARIRGSLASASRTYIERCSVGMRTTVARVRCSFRRQASSGRPENVRNPTEQRSMYLG